MCRLYSDMAGPEYAEKYKTGIFLVGSASAEFLADIALCPWEAVKVRELFVVCRMGIRVYIGKTCQSCGILG